MHILAYNNAILIQMDMLEQYDNTFKTIKKRRKSVEFMRLLAKPFMFIENIYENHYLNREASLAFFEIPHSV